MTHLTVSGAVDLTTLTGSLSSNEAFIHIDRAFDQIVWLVVRPRSALIRSQPVGDLEPLLEQLQHAWPTQADPLPLLRALHARLLAPIEQDLPTEGAIIISPRAGLHNVPWPALQGHDGRFWVERHATTLVPSAGAFLALRGRELDAPIATTKTLMVTGSSHFDPDKIRKAAGLGPDVPVIERVAQVSGVESDVLLVTAHGHFDASHPETSYLQLVPTARERGQLSLSALAQAHIKARVVVLHACDAARSVPTSGDEADSFVRAFLAGGARSVLAPLGALDRKFADRMLSELVPSLRAGEAPAQVLARVQRRMLRGAGRTRPEDPRRWGTIVASGAAL